MNFNQIIEALKMSRSGNTMVRSVDEISDMPDQIRSFLKEELFKRGITLDDVRFEEKYQKVMTFAQQPDSSINKMMYSIGQEAFNDVRGFADGMEHKSVSYEPIHKDNPGKGGYLKDSIVFEQNFDMLGFTIRTDARYYKYISDGAPKQWPAGQIIRFRVDQLFTGETTGDPQSDAKLIERKRKDWIKYGGMKFVKVGAAWEQNANARRASIGPRPFIENITHAILNDPGNQKKIESALRETVSEFLAGGG